MANRPPTDEPDRLEGAGDKNGDNAKARQGNTEEALFKALTKPFSEGVREPMVRPLRSESLEIIFLQEFH